MSPLFDFAVTTIFARECLEGSIIIGEYRTIIIRGDNNTTLDSNVSKKQALNEVTYAALGATVFALLVIAAIAIPLAILSTQFDSTTAYIIEGISKIVAAISLLQLSLKIPKMLCIYGSTKKTKNKRRKNNNQEEQDDNENVGEENGHGGLLTIRSIRFNVAWNIWREVAECGIFLIPFFLSGENLESIPLSAAIGSIVGLLLGYGIYYANQKCTNKLYLCIFAVLLLVILSSGLFTGGCHKLEDELGTTKQVWSITGDFWDVERLPMTILKPFGYNDTRTVLEIICYWTWLLLCAILHYRKYIISPKINNNNNNQQQKQNSAGEESTDRSNSMNDDDEVCYDNNNVNKQQTIISDYSNNNNNVIITKEDLLKELVKSNNNNIGDNGEIELGLDTTDVPSSEEEEEQQQQS